MFEPLPSLIRLQREAQGLTIDALSALAGVSRTRLIALEQGNDNISLELLVKIANALRITELRIGRLRMTPTTPDFDALVAAAEAIQTARKIVEQAAGGKEDLDRVEGPVAALLAPVITRAPGVGSSQGGGEGSGRKASGSAGGRRRAG
jgi:transcriptional regulator with XRE-family HTH domain